MHDDSDASATTLLGIECEALEGPTWGMGRQIHRLIRELAADADFRRRFRIALYCNNGLPDDPLYRDPLFSVRPTGPRALSRGLFPSSFSVYYYILLPLRLWRDRLFGGLRAVYYPNYMLPVGAPPRSLVMLTDDIFRESRNPALPFRYRLAYRIFATGWARLFATRIMAISHASAAWLAMHAGIASGRIAVAALGVDAPVPGDAAVPADFLFVGQAFPRRSLREALEAFDRIADGRPDLTFRIIGTDKYPVPTIAPLVERINARHGRTAVRWDAAYVPSDELPAAYRGARALVYVSETEGFGLPPLEALSYGTPAVLADTPLNREIYGASAFWVAPGTGVRGIEEAMRRSLDDTDARARIRAESAAVVTRYSWTAHARRWLDAMQALSR